MDMAFQVPSLSLTLFFLYIFFPPSTAYATELLSRPMFYKLRLGTF
jgi:uncharacterized membrane protein (DUF485 family)